MKKYIVTLAMDEREQLGELTTKGKHKAHKILNALILPDCDTGEFQTGPSSNEEIARVLNISMRKIDRVKKGSLKRALSMPLTREKEIGFTKKRPMVTLKLILLH